MTLMPIKHCVLNQIERVEENGAQQEGRTGTNLDRTDRQGEKE